MKQKIINASDGVTITVALLTGYINVSAFTAGGRRLCQWIWEAYEKYPPPPFEGMKSGLSPEGY